MLVALESLADTSDPSGAELADYAVRLGRRADELVVEEPLPGSTAVVRELRAVAAPEGLEPLPDTRLVALAAAMSRDAANSPRLELYPRDMGLVRALRLSQAAAGVRRGTGITVDELLGRVRARFPEIRLPETPSYVEIEDALKQARFELEYEPEKRWFAPRPSESSRVSSSMTGTTGPLVGVEPHELAARKLADSLQRGGFRALTLKGKYLPGTAAALAAKYPVSAVDFNALFLTEFRALTQERGVEWNRVLNVDARFGQTGELRPGLRTYLDETWKRVERGLLDRVADGRTVLFLHDTGLLARYYDGGGRELLVRLQAAARRPHESPHGLWLLCPGDSHREKPQLDRRPVEVTELSEQVVLDNRFLEWLKDSATAA